ncbi:hypothetical protein [Izhakiella capsodis]|uniref:hypothetical protein n=1 Tax=Izhakiella capsodis TaxID=1367852 RepID=UPI001E430A2B|nr:hypothetical protein [Izhakiella capsodis]
MHEQNGARHGADADTILNFVHGKQSISQVRYVMQDASEKKPAGIFAAGKAGGGGH